jgi:hypothetical protein
MRITKILILIVLVIANVHFTINSQTLMKAQKNIPDRVQDNVMGISFTKIGTVTKPDSSTYDIDLTSSASSPAQSAIAQVATTNKLFVDLPGSYGGRVYFDSPAAINLFHNRISVDSISTDQLKFHRGYWAVYAGMGMWDCVINCYTQKNGKYYIVSLVQNKLLGKPGEILNGSPLTAQALERRAVSYLQDSTNNVIKKFNNVLSSFRIQK